MKYLPVALVLFLLSVLAYSSAPTGPTGVTGVASAPIADAPSGPTGPTGPIAISVTYPTPTVDFDPPGWLKLVVEKAEAIPVVGPAAVEVFKWVGVIASIFTALATAFFAIMQSLSRVMKAAKLMEMAAKVDKFYGKVAPVLQYLSIYNVQKKS